MIKYGLFDTSKILTGVTEKSFYDACSVKATAKTKDIDILEFKMGKDYIGNISSDSFKEEVKSERIIVMKMPDCRLLTAAAPEIVISCLNTLISDGVIEIIPESCSLCLISPTQGFDIGFLDRSIKIHSGVIKRFDRFFEKVLSNAFIMPPDGKQKIRCNNCGQKFSSGEKLDFVLRGIRVRNQLIVEWLGAFCLEHIDEDYSLQTFTGAGEKEHSNQCDKLATFRSEIQYRDTSKKLMNGMIDRVVKLEKVDFEKDIYHGGIYYGEGWNEKKKQTVRKRDGYECTACGMTQTQHRRQYNQKLHVHHITKRRKFTDGETANRMGNLESLCASCHKKKEK